MSNCVIHNRTNIISLEPLSRVKINGFAALDKDRCFGSFTFFPNCVTHH